MITLEDTTQYYILCTLVRTETSGRCYPILGSFYEGSYLCLRNIYIWIYIPLEIMCIGISDDNLNLIIVTLAKYRGIHEKGSGEQNWDYIFRTLFVNSSVVERGNYPIHLTKKKPPLSITLFFVNSIFALLTNKLL